MALSIKNEEVDRLAREVAERAGESLTEAVLNALRERLERMTGRSKTQLLREDIARMQARIAELTVRDLRSDDEILGYDDCGLPQ